MWLKNRVDPCIRHLLFDSFWKGVGGAGGEGNLSPPTERERKLLGDELASHHRLACSAAIEGPLSITVPTESLAGEAIIVAEGEGVPFELSPLVRKYHVDTIAPGMDDPAGDAQRLLKALSRIYRLRGLKIDYPLLHRLPDEPNT